MSNKKYRVCTNCNKKKSHERFSDEGKTCKRCAGNIPKNRQIEMMDLLIALEKINTTLTQMQIEYIATK